MTLLSWMLVSHMAWGNFLTSVRAWKHLLQSPSPIISTEHYRVDTGKLPPGSVFSTIHSFHLLNQCCFPEPRLKTCLIAADSLFQMTTFLSKLNMSAVDSICPSLLFLGIFAKALAHGHSWSVLIVAR